MRVLAFLAILILLFGCIEGLEYADELISLEGVSEEGKPVVVAYSDNNNLFLELRNTAYDGIIITESDFEIKRYNADISEYMVGDYIPVPVDCEPINAEKYKSILRINISCDGEISKKSNVYEVKLTLTADVPKGKEFSKTAFSDCTAGEYSDNCTVSYVMVFLSK